MKRKKQKMAAITVPKVVADNIEELLKSQTEASEKRGRSVQIVERIVWYSGTIPFLWIHAVWFIVWILINVGRVPFIKPFDPYPFPFFTFAVSLDAIFLAIFVLVAQNRMQEDADHRAELDLHVNLLAERETTMILRKLARIENAMNITVTKEEELQVNQLIQDTRAVDIAQTIEKATQKT